MKPECFVHESAYVDDGAIIGPGTKIWHFCHVMGKAVLGENCSLGQNVMIASDVRIGSNVKIQNNVAVYTGTEVEDDVFLGPSCVLTNIPNPRSEIVRRGLYEGTLIRRGQAVDRLGQQARRGRLAGAWGAGEEISVMDAPRGERITQRADDVLLPHHFIKRPRSPLPIQRLHRHRCLLSKSPDSLTPSAKKSKSAYPIT